MSRYAELVAAYDAAEKALDALLDEAGHPPGSQWTSEMSAAAAHVSDLYDQMVDEQPWTTFVTCTGSSVVALEAGESTATEAFEAHLGADPYSRCGQCGSSNWELGLDPAPHGADVVLYAADVDRLLTERRRRS